MNYISATFTRGSLNTNSERFFLDNGNMFQPIHLWKMYTAELRKIGQNNQLIQPASHVGNNRWQFLISFHKLAFVFYVFLIKRKHRGFAYSFSVERKVSSNHWWPSNERVNLTIHYVWSREFSQANQASLVLLHIYKKLHTHQNCFNKAWPSHQLSSNFPMLTNTHHVLYCSQLPVQKEDRRVPRSISKSWEVSSVMKSIK